MFTGIIEERGTIKSISRQPGGGATLRLQLTAASDLTLETGASLAVDGVCLTVREHSSRTFEADLSSETLEKSKFTPSYTNYPVNLEPALAVDGTLDGHFVTGHVDNTGEIIELEPRGESYELRFSYPEKLRPFLAEKGSVAVDGVSLTVNRVEDSFLTLRIVPHTYENTTLRERQKGEKMNLEVDLLARYLYNFWQSDVDDSGLSREQLIGAFAGGLENG